MSGYTHRHLLCPICLQRPAATVVSFASPISPWETEPQRVLACTTPVCVGIAEAQAWSNAAVGTSQETGPLTREVAEDVTGDRLDEVAS